MSTGQADTGVLNAHELYARSIASSGVVDHVTGEIKIGKQFQKFGEAGGDFANVKMQVDKRKEEIEEAKKQQEVIDNFNKKAKELQDKISTLPESEQKQIVDHLKQQAVEYGNSLNDPAKMAAIMNDLDARALQIENIAVFKGKFNKSILMNEADGGLTDRWKKTSIAHQYLGILDGSTDMEYIDGEYKFLLSSEEKEQENENKIIELTTQLNELDEQFEFGGITDDQEYLDRQLEITNQISEVWDSINTGSKDWFSYHEMQDVINENSFDKSINNTISEIAKTSLEAGQNGESLQSLPNLNDIATNIVKEGNFTSLTLDSHIKGLDERNTPRNFKQDLFDSIFLGSEGEGTKWADLGLEEETIAALDPNTDGDPTIIGEQDAWSIVEAILDDENLATVHLTEYLYNHFKKQWQKGNNEYLANLQQD